MNTMNESTAETKDTICGMSLDKASALHTERNGEAFYFCGNRCFQKFLSTPPSIALTNWLMVPCALSCRRCCAAAAWLATRNCSLMTPLPESFRATQPKGIPGG